jgi:hypothetical protein
MRNNVRPPALAHLVRLDGSNNQGWQLRVPAWHPDGASSQYFADSKYGGSDGAFATATKKRDAVFQEKHTPLAQKGNVSHSKNTSKIVGVAFEVNADRPSSMCWSAHWNVATKQRRKRFSVKKYGFIGAWERAIATRQEKTNMVLDTATMVKGRLHCMTLWSSIGGPARSK